MAPDPWKQVKVCCPGNVSYLAKWVADQDRVDGSMEQDFEKLTKTDDYIQPCVPAIENHTPMMLLLQTGILMVTNGLEPRPPYRCIKVLHIRCHLPNCTRNCRENPAAKSARKKWRKYNQAERDNQSFVAESEGKDRPFEGLIAKSCVNTSDVVSDQLGNFLHFRDQVSGSLQVRTQLEGDRRQNLLDELLTRERLLLASFKNEGAEPDLIRSSLMTGGAKRGAPNPWLFEEPEETRGLGFDEIRQQQQKIIQEQDAGLDALSSIISRQKQMGKEIGNELDEQNEIIDDLANLVENTDGKLRTETRRMNLVDRKSTSCGMIMVILLLLVAIVVVAVWPTN